MPDIWPVLAGCVYVAFAGFAAIWIWRASRRAGGGGLAPLPAGFDIAYIGASAAFIVLTRLPILALSRDLQPDEAQYGANAIMAASGWLNWDSLDSGSSGPMQSMLQAWPLLFGWDVTFTTIHITGAAAACAMAALVYLILRGAAGAVYAALFTLPVTLLLGGVTYWDLVHSTSLYFPIVFSLFGAFAAVTVWRKPDLPLALAAAFALGLVPLIKPHGAILAGYAGVALILAFTRAQASLRDKAVKASPIVLAALAPLALSVVPLALEGRFQDFVTGALQYSAGYVGRPPSPLYWLKTIIKIPHLAVMTALFGAAIAYFGWRWRRHWRASHAFTWFSIGMLIVAGLSIMAPGKGHHHYLLYIVPVLPLPAAALAREVLARSPAWRLWLAPPRAAFLTAAIAAAMLPTALLGQVKSPALIAHGAMLANGLKVHGPRLLRYLVPDPQARLIVFGYMPGFYVDAGLQSGTRETWSENVLVERAGRERYRQRFIGEMDAREPAIFVDAVASGSFIFQDPAVDGPRTIPALAARLDRDYERVSLAAPQAGCSQIYLRHEDARRLKAASLAIAQVTASGFMTGSEGAYSPDHVADRHMFETCVDRWLAPPGAPAWLDVALAEPASVSRIALLNTRGAWHPVPPGKGTSYPEIYGNVAAYQAARTVVVKLMREGEVLAEKRVRMAGYPYWTEIGFGGTSGGEATHIRIDFPDWRGAGAGLNEVAVQR